MLTCFDNRVQYQLSGRETTGTGQAEPGAKRENEMKTNKQLMTIARKLRSSLGKPGMSTKRACSIHEIVCAMRATATAKRRVRIYSAAGFVPNSYRGRCEIQYVEAINGESGWEFRTGWTGAQRSRASGNLQVIQ